MNISVRLEGGLGDCLLGNRFANAIKEKYPKKKINIKLLILLDRSTIRSFLARLQLECSKQLIKKTKSSPLIQVQQTRIYIIRHNY